MADIELVIKIDNRTYNNFVHNEYSRADVIAMHAALINATPLPKGHGDLYNYNDLSKLVGEDFRFFLSRLDLYLPQPIIKADKKSEE